MHKPASHESTRKPDRRIQRTRELLRKALMELIVERGYDTITVQDITDRANVARTTFYLHFKDKDELLFLTMRDWYEEIFHNSAEPSFNAVLSGQSAPADASDFKHVAENAEFYRIMFSEKGSIAFYVNVQNYLAQGMTDYFRKALGQFGAELTLPVDLLGYILAGMQIAAYHWWLNQMHVATAEQMAQWMQDFYTVGIFKALIPKKSA